MSFEAITTVLNILFIEVVIFNEQRSSRDRIVVYKKNNTVKTINRVK